MTLPYSQEVLAIETYLRNSGVTFNAPTPTQINEGSHAMGSYHYRQGTGGRGRALDLTGPSLRAIYDTLDKVYVHLAELILDKNGLAQNVKNGTHVPIYDHAGNASTHVHVAVELGVFLDKLNQPSPSPLIQGDENMITNDPISGGIWATDSGGSLFAYDGAPYIAGLNTHPEWNAGGPKAPCIGIAFWKGNGTDDGGNGIVFATRPPGSDKPNLYHIARTGKPC